MKYSKYACLSASLVYPILSLFLKHSLYFFISIVSLTFLTGLLFYIDFNINLKVKGSSEIDRLRDEFEKEKLKSAIDEFKYHATQQQFKRDQDKSRTGGVTKGILF